MLVSTKTKTNTKIECIKLKLKAQLKLRVITSSNGIFGILNITLFKPVLSLF